MLYVSTSVNEILNKGNPQELRALFAFTVEDEIDVVVLKFNLWARYFFARFFSSKDAPFHEKMDSAYAELYMGKKTSLLNIAFRGGSKTTRAKLFLAFCISNDESHFRKYIKILSRENTNSMQFVTDVYNMLIQVSNFYPEIFEKTLTKREETMGSFTTATGLKVQGATIGQAQRGAVQEESRPDLIIFDDIEDRTSLRSAVITRAIWDNMEEAKNSLSVRGSALYLANYISELGNVHKLVERLDNKFIIPIAEEGESTWPSRYSQEDIKRIETEADDFEGEYLCKPNASRDIYFDREKLDLMEVRLPLENVAGFKIYRKYNPSHRYAGGHDLAGGVGLDSSTSVFIDFSTFPAQVVGTFASNEVLPEAFGDEIYSESLRFGKCLVAPENNKFDQTILKAKLLGANIYKMVRGKTLQTIHVANPVYNYGWNTNALTKSNMFNDLRKVVNDGLLILNDKDLIQEAKSFTRNDLIDKEPDPRLITRHFDLLTACAIAWQMKDYAVANSDELPIMVLPQIETVNPAE